jgi:hypothetical protein
MNAKKKLKVGAVRRSVLLPRCVLKGEIEEKCTHPRGGTADGWIGRKELTPSFIIILAPSLGPD